MSSKWGTRVAARTKTMKAKQEAKQAFASLMGVETPEDQIEKYLKFVANTNDKKRNNEDDSLLTFFRGRLALKPIDPDALLVAAIQLLSVHNWTILFSEVYPKMDIATGFYYHKQYLETLHNQDRYSIRVMSREYSSSQLEKLKRYALSLYVSQEGDNEL